MTRVRILAPYSAPAINGGGPIRTLEALARTAPADIELDVVTRDRDLGGVDRLPVPTTPVRTGRRTIRYVDTRGALGVARLAAAIRSRPRPDLTYVNSVFDPRFAVLPLVLRRLGIARSECLLIAPRGEFDPGALALKARKKRRYLGLARAAGLFRGAVWHASTELEAGNIRAVVGDRACVVVRENETSLPPRAARDAPPGHDRLELVTVGRISPKKRTHLVIEALATVTRPVRLRVIGSADDDTYAERCTDAAERVPDHVVVEFLGTLEHDAVLEVVRDAHAMVTATAGENFGHTIAEALSVGRPVLLPDTTPWSSRVREGGGEVVDDTGWATTITRWATMRSAELAVRAGAAADVYDRWRAADPVPHVFDMVLRPR